MREDNATLAMPPGIGNCAACCDALVYMFMPKPAAEGYAEKVQQSSAAASQHTS